MSGERRKQVARSHLGTLEVLRRDVHGEYAPDGGMPVDWLARLLLRQIDEAIASAEQMVKDVVA